MPALYPLRVLVG